ncbi:uncharacterized protein LOC126839310 [Adelges cooleyi]|uniref:uncharacterized protein LOC126839310 n=1 Tax=Adelges cooleyi TaxID=133065 RepID=UPI00217F3169|nr:uncharacterized protein LOC126839310 [Adelges cooleyi]
MSEAKEETEGGPIHRLCKKCNVNYNLIMLKVTLFLMYGATSSLLPYLTIHMQSIGLSVEEIAIVYLALPLTTFLAPPVTGFLVDKFGQYKPVLFISLALNAIFHHSLILIPQMETPGAVPSAYVMRHPESGKVDVWWSPCPSRECPEDEEINLVLDECDDHCLMRDNSVPREENKWGTKIEQSIAVRPPTFITGTASPQQQSLPNCIVPPSGTNQPGSSHQPGIDDPDLFFIYEKTKQAKNVTKPPVKKTEPKKKVRMGVLLNGNETVNEIANIGAGLNNVNATSSKKEATVFVVLDMHPGLMDPTETLGMELPEPDQDEQVTDFRQHFSSDMLVSSGVNFSALLDHDLRCGGRVLATNLTYNKLKELAADCMLQKCIFRTGGPERCPPEYKPSNEKVFWIYFGLRFIGTTMLSASVTVMDPIALNLIQRYGGEFGRERLFSTVGMALFSPLTGWLIDHMSAKKGYTDYSSAFYTYDILLVLSMMTLLMMPVGIKMPADHIFKNMITILKLPHVMAFLFFLFVLGNCWGFIESYLFLFLKELGSSNYLLGITVSVATISSIPFLYGAEKISKKIGHVNIIVIAFFSHAARLIGYSYIEDPLWVFPFEAIESLAVHLMWVAAATYCALLAPKNLLATLIGVSGMCHFSLGRGSGSFIGGLLIGSYGIWQSFRLMGLLAIVSGTIYGLLHCIWLHKFEDRTKPEKSDPSEVESLKGIEENNKEDLSDIEAEARRLSIMIKFNHRGSLASLDKEQLPPAKSQNDLRNTTMLQPPKVDLLKSTLELNYLYKKANLNKPILKKEEGYKLTPQANRKSITVHTTAEEDTKSLKNNEDHCIN